MALSITLTDEEATDYINHQQIYDDNIQSLLSEISELKAENSDLINSFQHRTANGQTDANKFCSTCRFCSAAALTEPARCSEATSPVEVVLGSVINTFYCSLYESTGLTE